MLPTRTALCHHYLVLSLSPGSTPTGGSVMILTANCCVVLRSVASLTMANPAGHACSGQDRLRVGNETTRQAGQHASTCIVHNRREKTGAACAMQLRACCQELVMGHTRGCAGTAGSDCAG